MVLTSGGEAIVDGLVAHGVVRRDQIQSFGGRNIGSDLVNPDFVKLAESFGVQAQRASSPSEFRRAMERTLTSDSPQLIVIDIANNSETSPWPFISPPS
jgi:acetolactate synthase-1/2/3 large subunit